LLTRRGHFAWRGWLNRRATLISTAIFDFDGTLAASLEGIHACFKEALASHGYAAPSLAAVRQTVGLTLEESVRILTDSRCNGTELDEVIASYRALYTEKGRAMATLFPGGRETLLAVRTMGIQIVVVSNKSYMGVCRMAEQLGIDGIIDLILGADSAPFRKPDARLYTESLSPHLPDPRGRQVLMVGDTESDLMFAKAADLRSCWASYGYGDEAVCKALAPEFILSHVGRLPDLLQNITD
jgi:phosphoglycolate phosphatase